MTSASAELSAEVLDLRARVRDLEAALRHARDVAAAERQRADRAAEASAHAWRVAVVSTQPRRTPDR